MRNRELIDEALTRSVIGCFYEVYNYFGGHLPEYIYTRALARELRARGHTVALEAPVIIFLVYSM